MRPRATLSVLAANMMLILSLSGKVPLLAAPAQADVTFTLPMGTAKTIQVTETIYQAKGTSGPLMLAGTMSFQVERPDKFRVTWKEIGTHQQESIIVSDGQTQTKIDGPYSKSVRAEAAEWPFQVVGLLNMQGRVSAFPALREGKKVLVYNRLLGSDRDEYWFDPKTHLLLRDTIFLIGKGKTSAVLRTDYSGWTLNKPIPVSVFQWKK